jgi:microcystin degradation protein MlrC
MRTVDDALDEVATSQWRKLGPIALVDIDDIVGAGAPGGNTHFVQALVRKDRGLNVLVPVHDPAAVEEAWKARDGARISIVLRGTPGYGQPEVPLEARIVSRRRAEAGRMLLLQVGSFHVAITERPPLPIHPSFWTEFGISARTADAIVQKNFFHYRLFYATMSFRHIPVVSAGASSLQRILAGTYRIPMHPVVRLDDWRQADPILRAPRVATAAE